MTANRYIALFDEIKSTGARRLLEVGTCKGKTAERMIRAALHAGATDVEYYGFDIFEPAPLHELTARRVADSIDVVRRKLAPLAATVVLTKGYTRDTLPSCGLSDIDLAYIDGGHSEETVCHDFWQVVPMMRPGAPIILDDYWNYGEGGCNALVGSLDRERFDVEILEPADTFPRPRPRRDLVINFARVREKC